MFRPLRMLGSLLVGLAIGEVGAQLLERKYDENWVVILVVLTGSFYGVLTTPVVPASSQHKEDKNG